MKTIILAATLGFMPTHEAYVTYEKDVKPVFSRSCARCHSGSNGLPNLMVYESAYKYRYQIKSKMDDRSMPHVGTLKESERELIRNWVNEGAKK